MTTFPLSGGTDTVAGSSGVDLITGSGADWQAADTIAAGAGIDVLQVTALAAPQAVVTDSLFQHVTGLETLSLLGKFAETVTLGALSDTAGLIELDGSQLSGNLSVDASARIGGIAIDAAKGNNTLIGSVDSDTFRFTSAGFTAADVVKGGGTNDADTIEITDKASVTDAAFANVQKVEHLAFGAGGIDHTGQKATLGALSIVAGIVEVDVLNAQGATLDAGARIVGVTFVGNDGNDLFKASQGNDAFLGGLGFDAYVVKSTLLTAADTIDGGGGRDEIHIADSAAPITDAAFGGMHGVEVLAFDAAGKQTVALGAFADQAGLDTLDASKVTGGLNLTVANTMNKALTVKLGTGVDTLLLGDGGKHTVVMKSTALTAADTITGNAVSKSDALEFTDAVKLADAYFAAAKGVTHIGSLLLDNAGKGQSIVMGAKFDSFAAASGLQLVAATGDAPGTSMTFDLSQSMSKILLAGSGGSDVFIAGVANASMVGSLPTAGLHLADSFRFKSQWLDASDTVVGGASDADELVILDAGTAVINTDFTGISGIERLRLAPGAANTKYDVTLGDKAQTAGIVLVDAAKAGVEVEVDAGAYTTGITILAGGKDNTLVGGSADDVFAVDTKTLNGSDFINGGASVHGDTLQLVGAGAVTASAQANLQNIEVVRFSDLGNSIVVGNALIGSAESVQRTVNGFTFPESLWIYTGKGKDSVDLSQLNSGGVTVVGSGGGDKYIGSAFGDGFAFQKAADLTAATQVDGGIGGNDLLMLAGGKYAAAQFKGVSHIETIQLSDTNAGADYVLTLDNVPFKTSDTHSIQVLIGSGMTGNVTVDASAATDPLATLAVLPTVGTSVLKGTGGNDLFLFGTDNNGELYLDSKDVVAGNGGTDTIALATGYNGTVSVAGTAFAGVSGIETLRLQVGAASTFVYNPGAALQAEGVTTIDAFNSDGEVDLNATGYTADLTVHAGRGLNDITLGKADDTLVFGKLFSFQAVLDAGDKLDGNAGADTIRLVGGGTVASADFGGAKNFETLELANGTFIVTLGMASDTAGIAQVDAGAAGTAASVNGAGSKLDLALHGSDFNDLLAGGAGNDVIIGGRGGDSMFAIGNNDVFVYGSVADSRQLTLNAVSQMDTIQNFAAGDTIDLSALLAGPVAAVTNKGTVGAFVANDTAGWFGANAVAAATDGAGTRIYVDADGDGNLSLVHDVVIQLVGNHIAEAASAATYV